jgi:NitT/TauT family transport system permease protein
VTGHRYLAWQLLLLAVLLIAWQAAASFGFANVFWVSSPLRIVDRFIVSLRDGAILFHTGVTIGEALSGLLAGMVAGVVLGLLVGISPNFSRIIEPFIIALNSLPRVALGPLIVMFVGIGYASKFLLAFSLVVVPAMLNTVEGVRAVDPILMSLMRVMGATRTQLFRKLILPTCVPWIFSAFRISISFAIVGAIVGELISARSGVGYMLDTAAGNFDTTGMLMPLFVLMIVAFAFDRLIVRLSARLLRWRRGDA